MKKGTGLKSIGLSAAAFSFGIFGMIALMASRRGGSLLTLDYLFYVFMYLCAVTVPLMISQFFIHTFQFRKAVSSQLLAVVFVGYAVTQAALGYFAAGVFDF